jgi:hypothetical protein
LLHNRKHLTDDRPTDQQTRRVVRGPVQHKSAN